VASMWLGLAVSEIVPSVPPSCSIIAVACAAYAAALAGTRPGRRRDAPAGAPRSVGDVR
jgi:hypothetical protein